MRMCNKKWLLEGIELDQYLPWKVLNKIVTGPVAVFIAARKNFSASGRKSEEQCKIY